MKTVLVIVGAAGAGKSTLMLALEAAGLVKILKPSTTRPKRGPADEEYTFIQSDSDWNQKSWAWEIRIRSQFRYGLEESVFDTLGSGEIGVTVFYPGEIDKLNQFRQGSDIELVTVGLDTIADHTEQLTRVGNSTARHEGPDAFAQHVSTVKKCDIVLKGSEDNVFAACKIVIQCLEGRGVLGRHAIEALLRAGTLLQNAEIGQVNEASYDLRLSSTVWSQGRYVSAEKNSVIIVPAYSYTVVEALEKAHLPSFIVGRYDLRVSMFLKGLILSNGPQVDPGFEGGLLCILFNASDTDYAIKPGDHFATIEFSILNRTSNRYQGQHQNQMGVGEFMEAHVVNSSGGTINSKMKQLETDWKAWRIWMGGSVITAFGLISGLIFGAYQWNSARIDELKDLKREVTSMIEDAKRDKEAAGSQKSVGVKTQEAQSGARLSLPQNEAVPIIPDTPAVQPGNTIKK